ncbi:hypothetical protein J4218_04335 [Candidatus Pacearchaeota archaeon]|nr:hypothetical protein [Candidatus Pacearchaeota archaeon]
MEARFLWVNMIFNKKSQVASTLTWFTSTLIIFFIMVLFLSACVFDSQAKKVSSGWDDVKLEGFNGNLRSQRVLSNLLNTNFELDGKNKTLNEWLVLDLYNMDPGTKAVLREKIREEVKKVAEINGGKICYIFQAVSGIEKDLAEILKETDPRGSGYVASFIEKSSIQFGSYDTDYVDPRGLSFIGEVENKLLNRATSIVLPRDTRVNVFGFDEGYYQKVIVKFYIGEC